MNSLELKSFLDEQVEIYNRHHFIVDDPISIPHRYAKKQDIEIAGFFSAMLAWGQRKTIINKSKELLLLMDDTPYDFVQQHSIKDLKVFDHFKHRTFNPIDCRYFIKFFKQHYQDNNSLETAFKLEKRDSDVGNALIGFHQYFFSLKDYPERTKKHIATPERNSACKRINMFLRWMVRSDDCGVDFGIWKKISMSQLVCPCDLHVERVARQLKLIRRNQLDWQTALELTAALRKLDPNDPVKYDFALFGLGVANKL